MADHSPSRAGEQAGTPSSPRSVPSLAVGEVRVVIDTNVVLDWLVFNDAGVQPLRAAVEAGRIVWHSHPQMRTEFAHMVGHADLARWAPDAGQALARFDQLVRLHVPPPVGPATSATSAASAASAASCTSGTSGAFNRLRCRDPDDQVFIDLAVACRARWLVTRDRALLALARPALAHGVSVLTPARWAASQMLTINSR